MGHIVGYLTKHLWHTVSLVMCAAIITVAIGYQRYMKFHYTDFLLEKNYLMEEAVLDTVQKNLDYSLMECIGQGAQIATRQDIYEISGKVLVDRGDTTGFTRDLRNNLSALTAMSANVLNISVISRDGEAYQYDRYLQNQTAMWSIADTEALESVYQELSVKAANKDVPRYLAKSLTARHPINGEKVCHIFYPLTGKYQILENMDRMLAVTFSMEMLGPFLEPSGEMSYSDRYITDETGQIIYHSDSRYVGVGEVEYLASSSFVTLEKPLQYLGWTLHAALDKEELNRQVDGILAQGILVYCLLLALLSAVFYVVMGKITRPLGKIKMAMDITGNQGRHKKVAVEGAHEIWQLADGYNQMLDKLEFQEREVERQHQLTLLSLQRQHQAEWETLESQINAHFICNTLGTINYEAIEGGNEKVSLLIKRLSNILRYTFDQKHQRAYWGQEIAWTRQYLYLQKARLEDKFDYKIRFDEQLADLPCCKLMLQPFVENAILHGFEGWDQGGRLYIGVTGADQGIRLEIRDNGRGIGPAKCRILQGMLAGQEMGSQENVGIGIRNVASRLRMFYGEQVDLTMASELGGGTVFVFILPFPRGG